MTKKITIIAPDNLIIIDGEGYNLTDEQAEGLFPNELHAIQGTTDNASFEWVEEPPTDFNSNAFFEKVLEKFAEVKEAHKPILPTLEEVKTRAFAELNGLADYYHDQISGASPQKLARYEAKAKAAAAYASAGSATAEVAALLQPEAIERGLTLEAHVEAILKANAIFTSAAGVIEAIQAKGKIAIEAANTIEELEKLITQIPLEAQKAFEKWHNQLKD